MNSRHTLLLLLFAATFCTSRAQTVTDEKPVINRQGQLFFYWGYNRSFYSHSDIHLTGNGYDITVHDAKATDRPTPFTLKNYFGLKQVSIPQYNYRVGYSINANTAISIGMDHMKYVLTPYQQATISGEVSESASAAYAGTYNNTSTTIVPGLLKFEHTDGLNMLDVMTEKYYNLVSGQKIALEGMVGAGVGLIIPRSDVAVFGNGKNNKFHISGESVNVQAGLGVHFFDHLFLKLHTKAGRMHLPNVLTEGISGTKANQRFYYTQFNMVLGYQVRLTHRNTQ